MDFARMKRRELLALCAEHGLAARGSRADLAATLAGAFSAAASAATTKKVVGVTAGKGCLKRSCGGPTGGSSGAGSKKVTFSYVEMEESGEELAATEVSTRVCQLNRIETCSSGKDVAGEICADPPETQSLQRNTSSSCADSEVQCQNILNEAEEDVKVERRAVGIKRKKKTVQSSENIAAKAQAGMSRRSTMSSGLSADDVLLCPIVKSIETNSSREDVAGEICADPSEIQSLRNTSSLHADSEFECQNILNEAEKNVKVERRTGGTKRKRKTLQRSENIAANAQAEISRRCTRSSGLPADDVLLCPVVEKKRGRRTAALGVDKKCAEIQDLPAEVSPAIIESEEHCKLLVQKSAVTGSCLVNATAVLHVVVGNKKMKTETVQLDSEVPAVPKSDVPRNDAPIRRSLRNKALQKNNTTC